MKYARFLFVCLFALFTLLPFVAAQTYEGRISGTVTDSSGAVVAGAKVTVANVATGISRKLVTNSAGEYVAPDLEPGSYTVSTDAPGFKTTVSSVVKLEVSRTLRIDLQLQPGGASETVKVEEQETLVDTTDSTLNGVLENKAINDLPMQGRDFQNLLPLHPGVQRTPGGGFQSITSNGNRPDENNYFIDGAKDNDVYYGESVMNEAGIQGTPASFLPLDAIQEFNTQESPSAEFGAKPGVVMNLGLKSGTNDIHGTAYYFGRNSALDARNYYDPVPQPAAALIMHEFGASIGGPILKNKWFYFVNYEGIRDKVGNPGVYDSPVTTSLAQQMGGIANSSTYSFPDAVAYCNQGLGGPCTPNPLSMQLSKLFLPNPGFTLKQSDPAAINFDFNNTNQGSNLVAKTDYHLNDHHVLSARYFYGSSDLTEMDTIPLRPEWLSTTNPVTQIFGVNWTWTPNSTWVNQAQFSFNSFNEGIFPDDRNVNPTTYGLNTGVTNPLLFGFPRINPGTDAFNYMGGNSSWPLETTPSRTNNWSDTVSYTAGKHIIHFGGEFMDGTVNYFRGTDARGRIDFSDLTDFVAGTPHRWEFLYGNPARNLSMKSFGLFAQDTYRIFPRFTLNVGLRYDVTYPVADSHNLLANYVPVLPNGQPGGIIQQGYGVSSLYKTNYNNFSPRLGFAWDLFGNGKTILRSGFGMTFVQPAIRTFTQDGGLTDNPSGIPYVDGYGNTVQPKGTITSFLVNSRDVSVLNWGSGSGPIFPASAGQSCSLASQCTIFAVNPNLSTPYVENWNLNLQEEITSTSMLQLAYVGNHGVNLYSVIDANQVNPALDDGSEAVGRPLNTNCPVAAGGTGAGGPCFPYIGFLYYLGNQARSIYNALQVTYTKRYSKGLYLLAGYTWGHAIDTSSSNTPGNTPQNRLDYSAERGNSDFDIRHRFTLSLAYDLPSKKTRGQLLEGWQVASIATLETGEPYSLYDYNDDISLTGEYEDRWNITGPPTNIHWSPGTPIPYVDPSSFTTDSNGNVIGGNQQCINAAGAAAVNQLATFGCYVSGSTVLTPPAYGTFGNMGRNIFRGPDFNDWDFSLSKVFRFNERVKMQLRAEVFNILNHPNFDVFSMNNDLSNPAAAGTTVFTPDLGSASNPVLGSGGSRHFQLAGKIIW